MIISDIMGLKRIDDLPDVAESVKAWFQVSEDIAPGEVVMIDFGVQTGKKVLKATTADDQTVHGVFEGEGLSLKGAETTISGLTGRTAKSGDYALIKTAGIATARFDMLTTAIASASLTVSTATAGMYMTCADPTLCIQTPAIVVGTATAQTVVTASATATATMKVWVRYFP